MELKGDWEVIDIEVDSGAIEHITNASIGKEFQIRETEFSKKQGYYRAANGTKIFNKGERTIQGVNERGIPAGMTFHIGDVSGPLGSVRRMVDAGNQVVFDSTGSYIVHKATGATTLIHDGNGKYVLKMWIEKSKGENGKRESKTGVNTGMFNALIEESDEQSFQGQGEDWI